MTPLEFANKYLHLEVYMYPLETGKADSPGPGNVPAEGWRTLRVARYRLGKSDWPNKLWQDISPRVSDPVTVKIKTISDETKDVPLTPKELRRHFRYPFGGKGSPEQAQLAIQLTYRYHKAVFTPEQFVEKDFIGLDCNGFVGNYIQRVVQNNPWLKAQNDKDPGPTTLIGDLLARQGRANQITDVNHLAREEIYLFGWCAPDGFIFDPKDERGSSYGHIMMTEPGTLEQVDNGWKIGVVEATAAGNRELRYLDYTITGVTKVQFGTVFQVLRGSRSDHMNVRVARLAAS